MDGKRNEFIQNLLEKLDQMLEHIEDHEVYDADFALVRALAENLREEVDSLLDVDDEA